jgi:hypothetical protein
VVGKTGVLELLADVENGTEDTEKCDLDGIGNAGEAGGKSCTGEKPDQAL